MWASSLRGINAPKPHVVEGVVGGQGAPCGSASRPRWRAPGSSFDSRHAAARSWGPAGGGRRGRGQVRRRPFGDVATHVERALRGDVAARPSDGPEREDAVPRRGQAAAGTQVGCSWVPMVPPGEEAESRPSSGTFPLVGRREPPSGEIAVGGSFPASDARDRQLGAIETRVTETQPWRGTVPRADTAAPPCDGHLVAVDAETRHDRTSGRLPEHEIFGSAPVGQARCRRVGSAERRGHLCLSLRGSEPDAGGREPDDISFVRACSTSVPWCHPGAERHCGQRT